MVWRVALNGKQVEHSASGQMGQMGRNLVAFQRGIVVSVILGANHTVLWSVEIRRVPGEIGELVVRPGEEEGRVLTRCDAGYPDRLGLTRHHQNRQIRL